MAFAHFNGAVAGWVLALFTIAITVTEVAVGLAIVIVIFRVRRTVDADHLDTSCEAETDRMSRDRTLALVVLAGPLRRAVLLGCVPPLRQRRAAGRRSRLASAGIGGRACRGRAAGGGALGRPGGSTWRTGAAPCARPLLTLPWLAAGRRHAARDRAGSTSTRCRRRWRPW